MQILKGKIYSSIYCHLFQSNPAAVAKVSPVKLWAQKLIHELNAKQREATP